MIKNVPDLNHVSGGNPKFLLWFPEALSFDCLDLIHGVVLLLPPLELFVQEVEDNKV
jgi:hypothetical protein